MRIGVIGDVHAEQAMLADVLVALRSLRVSTTLCTGDISDGAGSVDACCELLQKHRVLTVAGNHDRWLLADQLRDLPDATPSSALSPSSIAFLRRLPKTATLATPVGSFLLCHGLGDNDMASVGEADDGYALENNFDLHALLQGPHDLVVNGHTHRPMVRLFPTLAIVNAGTLKTRQSPCFMIIDTAERAVMRFDLQASLTEPARRWQLR